MYLKIQENAIRYRISQKEAKSVLAGQCLSHGISLTASAHLRYQLSISHKASNFQYDATHNAMILTINHQALSQEVENRPSKKGIIINQTVGPETLTISLEIDLRSKR